MQMSELRARVEAELRVEVRERLVEQERAWLAHDGAAQGDTLPLAAGQLPRLLIEELLDLQRRGDRANPRVDGGTIDARMRSPNARFSATVLCG